MTNEELAILGILILGVVILFAVARAERKHRQAMKTLCELRRAAWGDAAKHRRHAEEKRPTL